MFQFDLDEDHLFSSDQRPPLRSVAQERFCGRGFTSVIIGLDQTEKVWKARPNELGGKAPQECFSTIYLIALQFFYSLLLFSSAPLLVCFQKKMLL